MAHHYVPPSDEPPQCDLRLVIDDTNRSHDLAVQLRALLLQSLPAGSSDTKLMQQIADELVKCLASSLFSLHSNRSGHSTQGKENNIAKISCYEGSGRGSMLNDDHQRRRSNKMQNAWTKISSIPFEDGYLWRKYGQKDIRGAKYPRNYYRCIYSEDQGCRARKTVQQEDQDEDPPKFAVVYSMQHACRSTGSGDISDIPCVMESGLASLQSPPHPSSVSSNTVHNNCNSNSSNTTSGFPSQDGATTDQLLFEMLEQHEVPLGSPVNGFESRGDGYGLLPAEYFCWTPTDTAN